MDIVAALSAQLKLDPTAASGLAGGLLLLIEDVVREKASFDAASCIRVAIPEIRDWQMSSPTLAPGMLTVASVAAAAAAAPVHTDHGDFLAVLGRFRVDGHSAGAVASLMHQFLSTRLTPVDLAVVTGAMPSLTDQKAF